MKYHENILCISFAELTDGDPEDKDMNQRPVMTPALVKYYRGKNVLQFVRRGCFGQSALIAYSSLPEKYRDKVVAKYGDPERTTSISTLRDMFIRDEKARVFFQKHKVDGPDGCKSLKEEIQQRYINNASMLNTVIELYNKRTAFIRVRNGSTGRVWGEISDELNRIQEEVGCKLPKNVQSLRRLVEKYKEEGYIALVSKKHGNSNADKVTGREREALLIELTGDGRNLNNEMVAGMYNMVATKLGWPQITANTVGNFKKAHPETFAGRRGTAAYRNEKQMIVQRSAPTAPMLYWTADGWDAELLYKKKLVKQDGKSITTYHNRPTVVFVLDAFCKYIIGYAIGTHETPELIRAAFRNAFEHAYDLFGEYYSPWQIQTDNYGKGNLTPFYQSLTKYYTPAAQGNAKAKIIEPFNNWFNNKYCRMMPNTSGAGVKSRASVQVSDDWINQHKKEFPEYQGVVTQLSQLIEYDRKLKREQYLAAWKELPAERKLLFNRTSWLASFGELASPRKMHNIGITLQIDGKVHTYDTFDPLFRSYGHATFFLRYDPNNLSEVLAIENVGTIKKPEEGTVRFMLQEKEKIPMAFADRKPGDAEKLEEILDFNKREREKVVQKRTESGEIVRELFEENRDLLNDTLTAHVITDSCGQHKNWRNELRAYAEDVPVLEPLPVQTSEEPDDDYVRNLDETDFLNDF